MIVVALAAAAFVYQRSLGGDGGGATVIDGITFPAELRASGTMQKLCGGGTRLKYNVVKVYAVGLYFEPQAVTRDGGKDGLMPYVGMSAADLAKSSDFYGALVAGKFAKTLLLQFHRSVGADAVAGAMKDSLAKKVAAGALAKFSDALSQVLGGGSVPQGGQLSFACKADAMMIAFGESSPSTLEEKGVCVALFSVYYGSPPISPAAKEAAAKAFAELYV